MPRLSSKDIFVCGIERETMRIDQQGLIASTAHPKSLGLAFTNQYITTDFAESLIELVSPTFTDSADLMRWLRGLHSFVAQNIGDELLWPASMPPVLPDADNFTIANYGESHQGRIKNIYRRGLSLRYGRRMQTIAGIHLNLSFSKTFLEYYNAINARDDCNNTIYFHLLRNYIRNSWLINYLFGSSPAADESFFNKQPLPNFLVKHGNSSYYHPHSTCLRMGRLGYNNRKHSDLRICFNSLDEYINAVKKLTAKPDDEYVAMGVKDASGSWQQLNTNVLQIENEYYASVRPKAVRNHEQKTIDALQENGTEYLEIRNLDLDPFSSCGIDEEQIRFMQMFSLYLSLIPSPPISAEECQYIRRLEDEIIMNNLQQDQEFKSLGGAAFNLADHTEEMLNDMEALAELLDGLGDIGGSGSTSDTPYAYALKKQRAIVEGQTDLPALRQMKLMQNDKQSFVELMLSLATEHKNHLVQEQQADINNEMAQEAQRSITEGQQILEGQQDVPLDEFISNYLK